jgi:hypothetical protein
MKTKGRFIILILFLTLDVLGTIPQNNWDKFRNSVQQISNLSKSGGKIPVSEWNTLVRIANEHTRAYHDKNRGTESTYILPVSSQDIVLNATKKKYIKELSNIVESINNKRNRDKNIELIVSLSEWQGITELLRSIPYAEETTETAEATLLDTSMIIPTIVVDTPTQIPEVVPGGTISQLTTSEKDSVLTGFINILTRRKITATLTDAPKILEEKLSESESKNQWFFYAILLLLAFIFGTIAYFIFKIQPKVNEYKIATKTLNFLKSYDLFKSAQTYESPLNATSDNTPAKATSKPTGMKELYDIVSNFFPAQIDKLEGKIRQLTTEKEKLQMEILGRKNSHAAEPEQPKKEEPVTKETEALPLPPEITSQLFFRQPEIDGYFNHEKQSATQNEKSLYVLTVDSSKRKASFTILDTDSSRIIQAFSYPNDIIEPACEVTGVSYNKATKIKVIDNGEAQINENNNWVIKKKAKISCY